jgi:hypothetical protein
MPAAHNQVQSWRAAVPAAGSLLVLVCAFTTIFIPSGAQISGRVDPFQQCGGNSNTSDGGLPDHPMEDIQWADCSKGYHCVRQSEW